jgi:hypothetical protein
MGLIVQKFGGSSVADARRIHHAAKRAVATKQRGNEVVVVVSAMGDTTDELIDLAKQVCCHDGKESNPPKREMDQLLATGEQITIALMAMAIHAQGHEAISFTGGQIGMVTDSAFTKARIQSINKQRIFEQLREGKIVRDYRGGRSDHARPRRQQRDAGGDRSGAGSGCVRKFYGCGWDFYIRSAHCEKCAEDREDQLR